MRALSRVETARRLLAALESAPAAVVAELVAEVYPELVVELKTALGDLEARGAVVRHYRRWRVKRKS
jgi:hypothetical protein